MKHHGKIEKSLFFATLSCIAFQSMASPTFSESWSVGAGIGATTLMSKISSQTVVGNESITASNDVYEYGLMGTLFLSKNWVLNNGYYAAFDLGLNFLGADDVEMNQSNRTEVSISSDDEETGTYLNALTTKDVISRRNVEPYLDLKFGFLMTQNALLFLRGGLQYNTLTSKTEGAYYAQGTSTFDGIDPVSAQSSFNYASKKNRMGVRIGAGLEYLFTDTLSLGANYIYTFYPRFSKSALSPANEVACDIFEGCVIESTNFVNSSTAKNHDQQALLQLIYHFDKK